MNKLANPFKFGSVVGGPYFTNRVDEINRVRSVLDSRNHLILISPRRFGKTSLIYYVTSGEKRPVIHLNAQMFTSTTDFARQLVNAILKDYPYQKIKQWIKEFRIAPVIHINPVNGDTEISFSPTGRDSDPMHSLEDAVNLVEQVSSSKKRLILVIDEFQDLRRLHESPLGQMRSIMQHHKHVNYVFLGSQESMMRSIFEDKSSPFYHFGYLMYLDKIPEQEFLKFLGDNFRKITPDPALVSSEILDFTQSHPYYTQQLAWLVWDSLISNPDMEVKKLVEATIQHLVRLHDYDYERLWFGFNLTDRKVLTGMSESQISPFSIDFINKYDLSAASTVQSSLKRLADAGIVIKLDASWQVDDPFFREWIIRKRKGVL